MNAFIKLNRGILALPVGWQLWMVALVGANVVAPLFFLPRTEALLVLGSTMLSLSLMTWLTGRFGFSRILGLGHVFWIPVWFYLVANLHSVPGADAFGYWVRSVVLLNSISLAIDAVDIVRYIGGERNEIVSVT